MKKILSAVTLLLAGFFIFYTGLPVIAYGFIQLPILLLLIVLLGMLLFTKLEIAQQTKQVHIL